MYWTLVQCATGEILQIRIYGFYPVYPIGNTPNNDKTVLTYAMRKVVDNHRMQYVLLNVMYSTLVLCATGEILSLLLYYSVTLTLTLTNLLILSATRPTMT